MAKDVSELDDLYERLDPDKDISFIHRMLVTNRNYIIRKVKEPLRSSVEEINSNISWYRKIFALFKLALSVFRYPQVTKGNARKQNTQVLLHIIDKFFEFENNKLREPFFRAFFKVLAGQNENDNYYGSRLCWWLEELIKSVLNGQWAARPEFYPGPEQWDEPQPYGGENTIIYKLQQHRHEIIELIGGI